MSKKTIFDDTKMWEEAQKAFEKLTEEIKKEEPPEDTAIK